MGSTQLTFATWNIGGGIRGESHQRHGNPELAYYSAMLRAHSPDVVCLQEVHEYDASQAEVIAQQAGYPFFVSIPLSDSHMADNASLALAVLSRFPLGNISLELLPNPRLTSHGPDGTLWRLHDKGYLLGHISVGGQNVGIVNGHCFPLHRFGSNAADPGFRHLWSGLTADLLELDRAGPAVGLFDLNHDDVDSVLGPVMEPGRFSTAFAGVPTSKAGVQRDHIIHSHRMRLLASRVLETSSDHSYCEATLAL